MDIHSCYLDDVAYSTKWEGFSESVYHIHVKSCQHEKKTILKKTWKINHIKFLFFLQLSIFNNIVFKRTKKYWKKKEEIIFFWSTRKMYSQS